MNKDPHRFIHWMKKKCQANSNYAKKTFGAVSTLILDENPNLLAKNHKADEMKHETSAAQKKFNVLTPKLVAKPAKVISANFSVKPIASDGKIQSSKQGKIELLSSKAALTATRLKVNDSNVESSTKRSATAQENTNEANGAKDALNLHLSKLRGQFSDMHGSANQKMLELQSELGKMQQMSREFDVLAEFLTSEEKLSIFEQNLDRLQSTVRLTEDKIHEINTNNQKMARMIRQINETAKRQHENNDKTMLAIGERLERWELKLHRVTQKITNQKIDANMLPVIKVGDIEQLKVDIEHVLDSRLAEVSYDMENMKSVVICIISLVVLKMFVFDFFKDDLNKSTSIAE